MTPMRTRLLVAIIPLLLLSVLSPAQGPPKQPTSDTRYVVQLAESYATAKEADKVTWHLRRQYPNAHTNSPSGSETRYRVRVGPFSNREDAEQVAKELEGQGFKGAKVLTLKPASQKKASEAGESQAPQKKAAESDDASAQTQEADDAMRRA